MLREEPFYFLRHGQTNWNSKGVIQGQTDVPLNEIGRNQAKEAKTNLTDTPITTICCSPLARALQTADIINEALDCPLVIIDKLQECNFGEAEGTRITGQSYDDIIRSAESYGGEPFEDFANRVIAGINQALTHPGPVLVVSHGGVFHALRSRSRIELNGDMPNCIPVYLSPLFDRNLGWRMEQVRKNPHP